MKKSTVIIGVVALLLAASFASAASLFEPAENDKDFCFGYAICE